MVDKVSAEDLAKAFQAEEPEEVVEPQEKPLKKNKKTKSSRFTISLIVFVIGLISLVAGLVFLVLNIISAPDTPDAIFLTNAEEWVLDEQTNCVSEDTEAATNCIGGSGVIWKFTEVGKGTLTTNNHINDYDFIWAIDGDTLKIETDWLYTLNNEYKYELNQRDGVLTLTDEDDTFRFIMTKKKDGGEKDSEEVENSKEENSEE